MKIILFLCLFPCCLFAGNFPEKEIEAYLNRKTLAADQPGFSVLIAQNGQIVYEKQVGMANVKEKILVTPDTRFNIGSVTKQFTAMCIYLLEEQGKLKTSDSIRKYIPELNAFAQTITIDHLLAHGSGFKEYFEVLNMALGVKNKQINYESAIAYTNRLHRLTFAPGTDFQYSNTGYMMLALIVERTSGMTIGQYAQQNIFEPLGMKNTVFCLDEKTGTGGLTKGYIYNKSKKTFKTTKESHNALGATGVYCTLRDFFRWDDNFYTNKLGKKSAALIQRMLTPYKLNDGSSTFYGGGMFLKTYKTVFSEEHSGGWNSYLMQYRRFPAQKMAVMVCCNNNYYSPFAIADSICDMLLQLQEQPSPLPLAYNGIKPAAENFTGTYFADFGIVRHVILDKGVLHIAIGEGASQKKFPLNFDRQLNDSTLLFYDSNRFQAQFRIRNNAVAGFSWGGGHYFANPRYFAKTAPAITTGKSFTGTYRMEEFGRNIRIRYSKRKHALLVKPVFFKGYKLIPVADGIYRVKDDDVYIRFTANGMVACNFWVSDLVLLKK